MAFRRVLLKLSGEALGAPDTGHGIDPDSVNRIADQLVRVSRGGVELALVVGGGNILRGAEFSRLGASRASADSMGMLGTVINALALAESIEKLGAEARVQTAIEVGHVAEPFVRRKALSHLERKRVLVLAGGTGNPFVTTDTAAALRARELECEILLKATKVDGVYTADPRRDPSARRLPALSFRDFLRDDLRVMDSTAVSMCMEAGLDVVVFDLFEDGNIERVVRGESVGTRISSDSHRSER